MRRTIIRLLFSRPVDSVGVTTGAAVAVQGALMTNRRHFLRTLASTVAIVRIGAAQETTVRIVAGIGRTASADDNLWVDYVYYLVSPDKLITNIIGMMRSPRLKSNWFFLK